MSLYDVCKAECERQMDYRPEAVEGLERAVRAMGVHPFDISEMDIQYLAGLVNWNKPVYMAYRTVPAYFANGNHAIPAWNVPNAMARLIEGLNAYKGANSRWESYVNFLVKEFLDIHPFADGNGRVAFVLYNWLNGTLDNPVTLPYYYGDN